MDERLRAAERVWAAGDVTGVAQFTHVGKYQGRVAAANIAGRDLVANYNAIPAAVFTDPQVASVGDTSGEGAVVGKWGSTRFRARRRSRIPSGQASSSSSPTRSGRWSSAPWRSGLRPANGCGQITLAIRAEVPVATLRDTIQPLPTFSGVVYFAARELDL